MPFTLILAALLTPQAVPSADDLSDGKCVAALTTLSDQTKDVSDRAGVDGTMMYFMGRIVGRSGPAALKPAIEAAAVLVDGAAGSKVAESCIDDMQKVVDAL